MSKAAISTVSVPRRSTRFDHQHQQPSPPNQNNNQQKTPSPKRRSNSKGENGSNSNTVNNNAESAAQQPQQLVKSTKKSSIGFLSTLILPGGKESSSASGNSNSTSSALIRENANGINGNCGNSKQQQPAVIETYLQDQQAKRNVRNTLFFEDNIQINNEDDGSSLTSNENDGSSNFVNNNSNNQYYHVQIISSQDENDSLVNEYPKRSSPSPSAVASSVSFSRQNSPPKMNNNGAAASPVGSPQFSLVRQQQSASPIINSNSLNLNFGSNINALDLHVRNGQQQQERKRPNSVFLTKLKSNKQKKRKNPDQEQDQHPSRSILQNKPRAQKKRPYSTGASLYSSHSPNNQLSKSSASTSGSSTQQTPSVLDDPKLVDASRRLTIHGRHIQAVYITDAVQGDFKLSPSNSVVRKPGPISFLPDEVLLELMRWLEPEDLGRICTVCKRLYIFSETDLLWKDICNNYYPEETANANIAISNSSLIQQMPLTPHQQSKKSFLAARKMSLNNNFNNSNRPVKADSRSFISQSINQNLLTSRFFKSVFVEAYSKDVHLLRTGIWRNNTWKPKKSPWSKADYTYIHDSISNPVLNRGIPIKIVVVGDGAVGKTSLLCRYANDEFLEDYVPTIFENFSTQVLYQNVTYSVSLWDTAGIEEFDKLRPMSYKGADIFLLCFNLVNSTSLLNSMERWRAELSKHAPNVPIMLCGTKLDLRVNKNYLATAKKKNPNIEPVSFAMGVEMARKIGAVGYSETSSLTSHGVTGVFNEVMRYGVIFSLAQQQQQQAQQKNQGRCLAM